MLSYKLLQDVQNYLIRRFNGDEAGFDFKAGLCDPVKSDALPDLAAPSDPAPQPEPGTEKESAKEPHHRPFGKIRVSEKNSGKAPEAFAAGAVYSMPASQYIADDKRSSDIGELNRKLQYIDESFTDMLLRKIDESGMTDADCYHRAQLNRSHFNKIKNDPDYKVRKNTVIALALALSLGRDDADEMLAKAGYALSPSSKLDLIIEYCIEHRIYDVLEVNELLYAFDQELLGAGVRSANDRRQEKEASDE